MYNILKSHFVSTPFCLQLTKFIYEYSINRFFRATDLTSNGKNERNIELKMDAYILV